MTFGQQVIITVVEKGLLALLVGIVGFSLNRLLDQYKSNQAQSLEQFKQEQARSLEEFKTNLVKRVDIDRSTRTAIADLARKLATAAHTMQWLTWDAAHNPNGITEQRFETYDKEIHIILSDITASRAVLAALSPNIHRALAPFAKRIYELDAGIAKAKSKLSAGKEEALLMLQATSPFLDEFNRLFLAEIEKCAESNLEP